MQGGGTTSSRRQSKHLGSRLTRFKLVETEFSISDCRQFVSIVFDPCSFSAVACPMWEYCPTNYTMCCQTFTHPATIQNLPRAVAGLYQTPSLLSENINQLYSNRIVIAYIFVTDLFVLHSTSYHNGSFLFKYKQAYHITLSLWH